MQGMGTKESRLSPNLQLTLAHTLTDKAPYAQN
jgi:hypothetical protein